MAAPTIFISYAREDGSHAQRLFDSINETQEFSPWMDRERLLPGMQWKQEILEAITGSRFVILLLSQRAVQKTGFIQKEFREALDRFSYYPPGSIFIIPARLDECSPIHETLREIHWVDLFPDWDAGVRKILGALRSGLTQTLDERFDYLIRHRHHRSFSRLSWIDDNREALATIASKTIIEFLDTKFQTLAHDLYAIETMAIMAKRARWESVGEYVFRSHDVAKRFQYFHEWYGAYGVVLNLSKLLTPSVRTTFLRDIFENNVRFIEAKFIARDTSWADDLILGEVAKHYVVQKSAMYNSPASLIERALVVMTWDLPFLDLMTFGLSLGQEFSAAQYSFAIRLISEGFSRGGSPPCQHE